MAELTERMQLIDFIADNRFCVESLAGFSRIHIHAWAIGRSFKQLYDEAVSISAVCGAAIPECTEYKEFYSMPIK